MVAIRHHLKEVSFNGKKFYIEADEVATVKATSMPLSTADLGIPLPAGGAAHPFLEKLRALRREYGAEGFRKWMDPGYVVPRQRRQQSFKDKQRHKQKRRN